MPLHALRFRYIQALRECVDAGRRITLPDDGVSFETGCHIRALQRALQVEGFPLAEHGADGRYGPETASAVSAFKVREDLQPSDGVVGRGTMQRLDDHFAADEPISFSWPSAGGNVNLNDFLEAVQAAESANAGDTPEEFLTRFRQLYYPGTDPVGLTFREIAFDQLMPGSPIRTADGRRRVLSPAGMDQTMFQRLALRAFENAAPPAAPDNPSPYLVDATGVEVDIGHMLLTLEAIFHPDAGLPYTTFGVPAIDPASWVADLGIAAVWTEQDGAPGAPRVLPSTPEGDRDFEGYYVMSAPNADLLGDIDGFNIASVWQATGGTLSTALVSYYLDMDQPGRYRRRFRDFVLDQIGDPADPGSWPSDRARWEARINRFNDLFAIGPVDAFLTLTAPPQREWIFTSSALDSFYVFLEAGLTAELDNFCD